jgi:hypothetical protein
MFIVRSYIVASAILFCSASYLFAGVGLDVTSGPDDYRQNYFSFDANVSKSVYLGLGYGQSSSSPSLSVARSYSGNLGVTLNDHFGAGFSISVSPEVDNTRSSGWGMSGSYYGGSDAFAWGATLALNRTVFSEFTTVTTVNKKNQVFTSGQWTDLAQNSFGPSLNCTIAGRLGLSCGLASYGYNNNLSNFSQNLTRLEKKNFVTTIETPSLEGFPDRVVSAGASFLFFNKLRASCDWSRTTYVLDQPPTNSSTFGLSFTPVKMLEIRGNFNIVDARNTYYTLGMRFIW